MSICANPSPFQPLKDFRLITQIVSVPEILVVGEGVPARSLTELVALAKAQPGKLIFASTGIGGMPHLATELLKITAGIDMVHLPYRGGPRRERPAGRARTADVCRYTRTARGGPSGKLRALAIGSRLRSPIVPEVPTTAELGMPDVEADNWYGLVAPAAIPEPIASKLHAAAVEALHSPEVKDKLAARARLPSAIPPKTSPPTSKAKPIAGARSSPPPASRSSERLRRHSATLRAKSAHQLRVQDSISCVLSCWDWPCPFVDSGASSTRGCPRDPGRGA